MSDLDPSSFRFQRDQAHETIRELLALLDGYTEVDGVMWCTAHDGIADETNTGDICDQNEDGDADSCHLVALHYRAES